MALTLTSLAATAGSGTSWVTSSLTFVAGDLIVVAVTNNSNGVGQQITGVSDDSGSGSWTSLGEGDSSSFDAAWWYKVANGSETEITVSFTATIAYDGIIAKGTGHAGTWTLEGSPGEDESYLVSASTTSVGGGSITNTTASALALMMVAVDGGSTMDAGRAVSDGASYTELAESGTQIFLFCSVKSATGTYSPVYSFSDTGDQCYGASAIFGDVSGGGGGFQPAWARGCNALLKAA